MPDGKTHKYVGITAGIGFAAYQAKEQKGPDFWLEVIGGGIGGWPGGKLPDIFEPGTSSYHRGVAHSLTTGGAIVSQIPRVSSAVNFCRERAEQCKASMNTRRMLVIPLESGGSFTIELGQTVSNVLSVIEQILWRLFAGFLNGVAAGYVSHLALDAMIGSRSIPLLAKGC